MCGVPDIIPEIGQEVYCHRISSKPVEVTDLNLDRSMVMVIDCHGEFHEVVLAAVNAIVLDQKMEV